LVSGRQALRLELTQRRHGFAGIVVLEQVPQRVDRCSFRPVKNLDMRMEGATGSDVALGADLLSWLHEICRLHTLRLRVKYLDMVARGLLADRIPLFDDDTTKMRVNFRNLAKDRRPDAAMWRHASPTVHVDPHMWRRTDVPVGTEVAGAAGPMALFRRFDQVDEALNYGINRHADDSVTTCAGIWGGRCPHPITNQKCVEL
jgi:hypothetical protein